MRRIILAVVVAALTGCGTQPDAPDASSSADAETGSAARSASGPGHVADSTSAAGRSAARLPGTGQSNADGASEGVRTILFVGTSLTAGYGIGADYAYPSVIQQLIDSAGLPYRVVNAGISGETSAGGLRRIDWSLQQPADVLVLELGANDALRGLDPDAMHRNLDTILQRARRVYPEIAIVIVGMEAPPNLGEEYAGRFRRVFTNLAREYDAALVPFLLEGVAAEPSLNLEDGIHPNMEGHRILARTVWRTLEPVLSQRVR